MISLNIPIGAAVLFAFGGTLVVVSGILFYMMIGEVNRKLPEDQQIGYFGFYPAKVFRITGEFRRLYPHSHINTLRIVLTIIGFLLMVASAAPQFRDLWR
jgi:hypothetical protein